jgi:hypothetical protein
MVKGYPMILSLQTKLAAQSSVNHRHIGYDNCGEIPGQAARKTAGLPGFCSPHVHNEFSGASVISRLDRAS